MEMKSRLPQIIYTLTAIFTAGTVATTVLYQSTSKEILQTLAITFGTCAYHFIMRLLVGSIVNSILHNKVDYCKRWFQVSESEKKIYEKLGVKNGKIKCRPTDRTGLIRDSIAGKKSHRSCASQKWGMRLLRY